MTSPVATKGKRCCVYSSVAVACSGPLRPVLASDGALFRAARSVSPLVPVNAHQPFSTPSKTLPAHTTIMTAGPDSLALFLRPRRAAQRLLYEAVERKLDMAVDRLWMVDDATDTPLGALLQVIIFSTHFKSILVQLRGWEGKLRPCLWQAREESAVELVGV